MTQEIFYKGAPVRAHVMYGGGSAGSVARTAFIDVRRVDVPDPKYRDEVEINGDTWRVYQDRGREIIISGGRWTWKIPVKLDERPKFK